MTERKAHVDMGRLAIGGEITSRQSARQAARRSVLDAHAVLRRERADRERWLEVWRSPC